MRSSRVVLMATLGFFCVCLAGAGLPPTDSSRLRADRILINTMTAFGRIKRQPVEFLHDVHTDSLTGKNRDCTACHPVVEGRMSLKFMRAEDTNRTEVMNIYHQGCISCHGEMRLTREKTGPVDCNGCHRKKTRYQSSRSPMGFDKSLHFRHSEAQQKKCEQCHHAYDEVTKKLFYPRGDEGTCRYCHQSETRDNVISMRLASHIACINCHAGKRAGNLSSGPIKCAGCHDAAAQAGIKKTRPLPRMDRKQPDAVLLRPAPPADAAAVRGAADRDAVPFNHQGHEEYSDTCRVCHHESLKPCRQCHTPAGIREGNGVTLKTAMHQNDTDKSCAGCHNREKEEKNCAGCHAFRSNASGIKDDSCLNCHVTAPARMTAISDADAEKSLAADLLQSRTAVTGTCPEKDIPDKLVLSRLSREYEAVDFPHGRIIRALAGAVNGSRLAAYFHDSPGTICRGCHHHSPASVKPPSCGHCHGLTADGENPLKPGITGAYHQQCMGCHQAMNMTKINDCTGCHQPKKPRPENNP